MRAYPGLDPLTSAPSNLRKFDVFAIDTLRLVETTAAVNGSPTVFNVYLRVFACIYVYFKTCI